MPRRFALPCLALGCLALSACTVHLGGHPGRGIGKGPPPHAPAHGYRRQFAYVYYPTVEVYFAPDRGTWFWLDGGRWRAGTRLPDDLRVRLGGSVNVNLDTDHPHERHASVVAAHPAP